MRRLFLVPPMPYITRIIGPVELLRPTPLAGRRLPVVDLPPFSRPRPFIRYAPARADRRPGGMPPRDFAFKKFTPPLPYASARRRRGTDNSAHTQSRCAWRVVRRWAKSIRGSISRYGGVHVLRCSASKAGIRFLPGLPVTYCCWPLSAWFPLLPRAIQHQLLAAHAATIADVIDHGILPGGQQLAAAIAHRPYNGPHCAGADAADLGK